MLAARSDAYAQDTAYQHVCLGVSMMTAFPFHHQSSAAEYAESLLWMLVRSRCVLCERQWPARCNAVSECICQCKGSKVTKPSQCAMAMQPMQNSALTLQLVGAAGTWPDTSTWPNCAVSHVMEQGTRCASSMSPNLMQLQAAVAMTAAALASGLSPAVCAAQCIHMCLPAVQKRARLP